ncbi:type IV pilus twitching motility protein PilT [bacterium]|nr:type IV pilus twitching motility protein PilT [bacterium]
MNKIDRILIEAVKEGASDIIFSVGKPPVLRIRGDLVNMQSEVCLDSEQNHMYLYELLSNSEKEEFDETKEIDFSYEINDIGRFRVNLYIQKGHAGGAFRLIPSSIPKLSSLGLPDIVKEFIHYKKGLILITGQTGSGKSTTLASIVDRINEIRPCHIITLEDPIEFIHNHKKAVVDQREVGNDTNSFSIALKHILRQDPDVILIGEMRDIETIKSAITLAETGHLVFATLHTFDASQTIDRIIDVFPSISQAQIKMQLSMVLRSILSQQLIPSIDGKRTMVCEILVATNAIKSLIREGKTHQIYSTMQTSAKAGMVTMNKALKQKVIDGIITSDFAKAYSMHPNDLDDMLNDIIKHRVSPEKIKPVLAPEPDGDSTLEKIRKIKEKREEQNKKGLGSILDDDFKFDV